MLETKNLNSQKILKFILSEKIKESNIGLQILEELCITEKILSELNLNEGLLDRIIDELIGKSSRAEQMAKNFTALIIDGDLDAIQSPRQVSNIRKLERNISRIKKKFDKLIIELGEDLVAAIGTPDAGPLKGTVDHFDTAVSDFRKAMDSLMTDVDSADDKVPVDDIVASEDTTSTSATQKTVPTVNPGGQINIADLATIVRDALNVTQDTAGDTVENTPNVTSQATSIDASAPTEDNMQGSSQEPEEELNVANIELDIDTDDDVNYTGTEQAVEDIGLDDNDEDEDLNTKSRLFPTGTRQMVDAGTGLPMGEQIVYETVNRWELLAGIIAG